MNTQEQEQTLSVWEFLERENTKAPQAEALYRWGLNCDRYNNPFLLYLDLIGWSDDNYGANVGQHTRQGYTEADYLADALKEWAVNPHAVENWLDDLMDTEGV